MKKLLVLSLVAVATGAFAQTFSDNFNRADGGLGTDWTPVLGNMQIIGNEATGTTAANGLTLVNSATFVGAYNLTTVKADMRVTDQTATLTYCALVLGGNGLTTINNGIFVKFQRQVAGGFSHVGIYTGSGQNSTAITTPGGNFQALGANAFTAGRVTVRTLSATSLYTGVDTNFDNVDEFSFTSTLNLGTLALGNRVGAHTWGTLGRMDNYNATVVPEPATMAALGLGAVALIRRRRK